MKPSRIFLLDKWLGKPAAFCLTLAEGIRRLFSSPDRLPPRRIVFVKLIEMGSTVLACPAFSLAVEMVGKENIFLLVFRTNRPIADLLPYFSPENVVEIDDSNFSRFLISLFRARGRLRREKVDTAIDLEGLTRSSAVITWLTGARNRVGYANFTSEGPYRGRLFNIKLNYTFQHHVSRTFISLVRALESPAGQIPRVKENVERYLDSLPSFTPPAAETEELSVRLAALAGGTPGHPRVILNANCSDLLPLRRWPEEYFVSLGREILSRYPASVLVLTGTAAERPAVERLAAAIGDRGRCLNLAGMTTFRELLTLYGLCDLLVSNDSGPCHFATLTPIKVIALFGPETPLLYAPLGKNAVAVSAGLTCSPCVNILNHRFSPCRDNVCMRSITVKTVMEKACRLLDSRGERGSED